MSTPHEEALPREAFAAEQAGQAAPPAEIGPDNPPWSVLLAVLFWIASVVLLGVLQFAFLIPYALSRGVRAEALADFALTDPTAIVLQIGSTIPAHLLTLGLAWLLVTRAGKYPFFRTLGWGWSRGLNFWKCAAMAVALLLVGLVIIWLSGNPETPLDKLINSSRAAAVTTAFLATFTAPLVEEVIYRGVLYSALQRAVGAVWAVVAVFVLFALIHVPQYRTSYGVISAILILSIFLTCLRAYTGKLLPCVVVHFVFNGIQSVFIAFGPELQKFLPRAAEGAACVLQLAAAAPRLG